MRRLALTACLLLATAPAAAQEPPLAERDLPPAVRERVLRIAENPDATRFHGPNRIGADHRVRGPVVAVGGPLTLAGRVDGDLAVIDGGLVLEPGAVVGGDIVVVGGTVDGVQRADIGGTMTVYGRGYATAARDEGEDRGDRRDRPGGWRDRRDRDDGVDFDIGRSRFAVRAGASYNRVEGLPVRFGPIIETAGPNPTRVQAFGVWRTEAGSPFDTDDLGYDIRAEQFVAGRRLLFGGSAHSVVEPIEAWQLRDPEAALSTFLLHDDPRDYFERVGWSVYARLLPRSLPLDATLALRDDDYGILAAQDPFTLFRGSEDWRLQPLVAAGELRSLHGRLVLDTRDRADDPTRGWYAALTADRGLSGDLARPALRVPDVPDDGSGDGGGSPGSGAGDGAAIVPGDGSAVPFDAGFTRLFLDARHYARVAPGALLNVRAVVGGAPGNTPLPPQFQHAAGGVGSLPGFDRFALDCGARAADGVRLAGVSDGPRFHPFYGCDRIAVLQVEYVGSFGLDIDLGWDGGDGAPWDGDRSGAGAASRSGARAHPPARDRRSAGVDRSRSAQTRSPHWWDWDLDSRPAWVAFADAGRGWALPGSEALGARDTDTFYDIGVGLLLGDLGLYAALPLRGGDESGVNFFLRLGRRF